jgi:hypothetical protein
MYNTNFVVKYRDIEYELVNNLRRMEQKKLENAAIALLEKEKLENAAALLEKEELKKKKGGRKKAVKNELKNEVKNELKNELIVDIVDPVPIEPKKRGRKKTVKEEVVVKEVVVKEEEVVKEEDDDDEDLDIEYTMDDVRLICEKLYRDELLSVFEAESINDPNMDTGIKRVIEKMIDNVNFKQLLEDIKHEIIDVGKFTGTPTEIANLVRNSEYLIFITLFSQHVFYITHKCICQLFTVNEIDPELIAHLKNKTIGLFKR